MREKHLTNTMKIQSVAVILLSILILSFSGAFFLMKKQAFSESENRYLEKFPQLSFKDLKEGKFTSDLQSYLADHFPLRDVFMGVKAETEIALGKREINGIYIADDGYLIEEYKAPKNTEKITGNFGKFFKAVDSADVSLMLVPTAVTIYADKLPAFAPVRSQLETRKEIYEKSGVPPIDCYDALMSAKDEMELYYRTDHHWTSYGAYTAYRAYCEAKGIVPVEMEQLDKKEVATDFKGTIYSKLNDGRIGSDTITIFENPKNSLTVSYLDTKEITDSLYNFDYLDKKDKYSMFLNNIHPLIEITNETADSDKEMVLIKDSYANSMVPFLVNHYKKIYVFDTRYYKKGPSSFIREHPEVTDVLLVYNMNTLDTDLGVGGIY
ncbi:DHHW family protein [Clostridium sp. AM58-1XD]|uniref:DHHW family protein n=1 Tax=Clostridium sp. AM58-1XD TaxID=2292307 RepID=UPI000E4A52CD|nr:DHHW family protein [Clostridium sp. AM58-1XD]RGY97818.1 hypothetical protein DXA13_13195 [Clostridium sp. AM58-1XD]